MMTHIRSILEQWQANQRLRFGVWIILAIVLTMLALSLHDLGKEQQQLFSEALKKNIQTRRIAEDRQWLQTRDQLMARRAKAVSGLLRAQTVGLAQADVRTLVDRLLQEEGIKVDIINVGTAQPVPSLPGCYSVEAGLHGAISLGQLFSLLYRLESATYTVVVDGFVLRPDNRQNFSLECRFFVLLAEH